MVGVGQSQQSLLFDQKYSVHFYFKTEKFNNIPLFPLLLISLIRGCFGVKNNTRPRVKIFTEGITKISANICHQPLFTFLIQLRNLLWGMWILFHFHRYIILYRVNNSNSKTYLSLNNINFV